MSVPSTTAVHTGIAPLGYGFSIAIPGKPRQKPSDTLAFRSGFPAVLLSFTLSTMPFFSNTKKSFFARKAVSVGKLRTETTQSPPKWNLLGRLMAFIFWHSSAAYANLIEGLCLFWLKWRVGKSRMGTALQRGNCRYCQRKHKNQPVNAFVGCIKPASAFFFPISFGYYHK